MPAKPIKIKSTMEKKYDLYELSVDEETLGMYAVSLVDEPAMLKKWLAFSKDGKGPGKAVKLAIQDEERHKVLGPVLRADFPVYRFDEWGEYYIIWRAPEIEKITRMFLEKGFQNAVNLDHNPEGYLENGEIEIEQLFIKNSAMGLSPKGFEEIEEGSLFAIYKVKSQALWDLIKAGEWNGFSMEGFYRYTPVGKVGEDADENTEREWEKFLSEVAGE